MPDRPILILGGTKEAAALAAELTAAGKPVITSLAGRTKEPMPVAGKVRIGGFGGAEGLARYLSENDISQVIDMTHPFAKNISANAVLACKSTGTPLDIRTRKPWEKQDGDLWTEVETLDQAAEILPNGATVLLALGKQYLTAFETRQDCTYIIRMVDPPENPLPFAQHHLLIGKPSADWQDEAEMLKTHAITQIVCRNSGGDGAYAKIRAARELALPVVMVGRSVQPRDKIIEEALVQGRSQAWQEKWIAGVEAGIEDAERSNFATDEEISAALNKFSQA